MREVGVGLRLIERELGADISRACAQFSMLATINAELGGTTARRVWGLVRSPHVHWSSWTARKALYRGSTI